MTLAIDGRADVQKGRDVLRGGEPIELRKRELNTLLASCGPGLVVNRAFDEPGDVVYTHACLLGARAG